MDLIQDVIHFNSGYIIKTSHLGFRTMALGSTKTLTEMSTRNLKKKKRKKEKKPGGKVQPARRADNPAAIC
jgi:hypothetical protein